MHKEDETVFIETPLSELPVYETFISPRTIMEYARKVRRYNLVSNSLKSATQELIEDPDSIHGENWQTTQEAAKKFHHDYPYIEASYAEDRLDQ